jgi:hypothetical protein
MIVQQHAAMRACTWMWDVVDRLMLVDTDKQCQTTSKVETMHVT